MKSILSFVLAAALMLPAAALACGHHGHCGRPEADVTCYGPRGNTLVDVDVQVCKPRFEANPELYLDDLADADAEAYCRAKADADPVQICGSLSFQNTKQICDPYLEQNQFQICAPKVQSDPDAYCGSFIDQNLKNYCDPYVQQTCGDATAICGGDHDFLGVALAIGGARAACDQNTFNMLGVKQTVIDASTNAFTASNACTTSLSVNDNCPDVSVSVEAVDGACRKCRLRTIRKKDGSVKKTVKVCKGPCVFATKVNID